MSDDTKNLNDDLNNLLEDAKEKAKEFTVEAKTVLSDGKNIAIIAHITIIGWIIALIMNTSNKTEFASFYIRQTLGLFLVGFVSGFIPLLNLLVWLTVLVALIMSLIAAMGGEKKLTFLFGAQFQDWFKGL